MALNAIVASIDSLPADVQSEYRQPTDAEVSANPSLKDQFVLDVTPTFGFGLDNVEQLRGAVSKAQGRADTAETALAGFDGLKPDEVKANLTKLADLEKLDPEKDAEAIAKSKIEAAKTQMAEANKAEVDKEKARASGYRSQLENVLVNDKARAAIAEAKGSPEALLPHITQHIKLKETDDGKFVAQVVDAEGNPRIGDSAGTAMTINQLVEEYKGKDTFAALFEASGDSGGGAGGGDGGGSGTSGGGTKKKSEMDFNERADFIDKHGQEAYLKLPA